MTTTATQPRTTADVDLRDVAAMTAEMRLLERKIQAIAARRTEACRRHNRDHGITYAQLAKAMGLSDVAVYKILRGRDTTTTRRPATKKVAITNQS